jgi:tetratricopeptide (TPR) repeat protein
LIEIGYPRSALIIVEYAAEPVRPGIFRKLSVFRVADRYLPHVCVHDSNWIIKAGRSGAAPSELYDEELEILRTNPFAERMKPIFEIAEIDFGRVDFSFVGEQLCIYEINTNPTLARPHGHAFPQRTESMRLGWEGLLSALHAIDHPAESGSRVDVGVDDATTLRKALDIYPFVKDGSLHLSEAYARRGDSEKAIKYAESALAQAPDDIRVTLRVSSLLADNDKLGEAIASTPSSTKTNVSTPGAVPRR